MSFLSRHKFPVLLGSLLLAAPAAIIWTIAGSDNLFTRTVPIEQRLVSHNESIRTKAQQELLGLSPEAKKALTTRILPALGQEDRVVRKWAVIALALMGPAAREAIPALLQGVSSGEKDVAQACRVALSEIGAPDPEQLPALLQSLQDSRPAVRCEAAATIAKLGPLAKDAVPILANEVLQSTEVPVCAGNALAVLADAMPEKQDLVLKMLDNVSPLVRWHGAYVLAQMTLSKEATVVRLLTALAGQEETAVRRLLAKALNLRRAPERGAESAWTYALLHSTNPLVRATALHLLEEQDQAVEQVAPSIWKAVKDDNADIRLEAVKWLGKTGPKARPAASYLLSAVSDSDVRVRRAALSALKRSGTRRREGLQLIGRAQRDPDPLVRCLATEELLELGSPDRVAVPLLINDLKGDDDSSRCAAEALGLTGHFNRDVVPALINVLQEKDPLSRSRAALVLMQLGAKAREALPALILAQRDQIPDADNAIKAIRESLPRASKTHRRHSAF